MAWFSVRLTEEQQQIVDEERNAHPNPRIREKMLVLWLLHHGLTHQKVAEVVRIGRTTVYRYVVAFREGGLDRLRQWNPTVRRARCPPIATSFASPSRSDRPAP